MIVYGDYEDRGIKNNFQISSLGGWMHGSAISHCKEQKGYEYCLGMAKMGGSREDNFYVLNLEPIKCY